MSNSNSTTFGKNIVEIIENSDVIYPYSGNKFYANNAASLNTNNTYNTRISIVPINDFDSGVSSKDYFNRIISYYDQAYWNNHYHFD